MKFINFCLKCCNKIIFALAFIFLLFLTIDCFINTSYIPPARAVLNEMTYFYKDNMLVSIIILALFFLSGLLLKKVKIKEGKKNTIINILLFSLVIISVLWVFMANYNTKADSRTCFLIAKAFSVGDFTSLLKGNYLFLYPFQLGLIFFEEILYRLFGNNSLLLFQIINCVSMVLTYYLIIKIFNILFKKENNSLLLMLFLFLFIFFVFFCSFVYGNLISFSLSVVSIYFFLLFREESKMIKKIIYSFLSVMFMAFAYAIKSTALITVIAILIISFLSFLEKKDKMQIVYIVIMILFFTIPLNIIFKYYEYRSGYTINDGIPKIGWIAMGLHEGPRSAGWYDDSSRNTYVKANYDNSKFNELIISDINNSLDKFKNDPKYAFSFFYRKISSQWNNPSFQTLWNLTDTGQNRIAKSLIKGELYRFAYFYGNYFQLIIYLGCLLYLILYRKDCNYLKNTFLLIFIGGFLFYCIWEAKSQYVITFFVILIPYASLGYNKIWNITLNKLNKK